MNDTISISTARANLPQIVDSVSKFLRRFTVTVNGDPKVVVISAKELKALQEERDALEETAEILSIPGAREAIAEGEQQLREGQGVPLEEFLKKYHIDV